MWHYAQAMRRAAWALVPLVLISTVLVLDPGTSGATCPTPAPGSLSYEEMIEQGTTGSERYPIMILGVVVTTKNLGGPPRGAMIAKMAVAEHPVGFAPLVSRVRFWRDPGGEDYPPSLIFEPGHRYVVIAHRRADGTFTPLGPCGPTSEVDRETFRALVRLARAS